jgi:hypothetical protein
MGLTSLYWDAYSAVACNPGKTLFTFRAGGKDMTLSVALKPAAIPEGSEIYGTSTTRTDSPLYHPLGKITVYRKYSERQEVSYHQISSPGC